MSGIKIPIQAAFDQGDVNQVLAGFQQQINRLGQAIAQANKVKFNPIDRTTVDDIRRVTAGFENLRRVSGDLNRRIRATGQERSGFTDLDWSRLYPDANSRARQMQKAFTYVVGNQFQSMPTPGGGGAGGGGSGGGGGGIRPPSAPPGSPAWQQAGRTVVGAGLNALGPAGGVANSALSAGMASGIGAGVAGLVGGMAALALGKAISAVMNKVGDAQREAIGYDTLKRTLGDVNVSFDTLRGTLRESARALDMTFDESQRLGIQFAKLSNMTAEQYKTLADEVGVAGGLGRSFGLDPSQTNAFFAQMRLSGVTSTTRESRELALMIGESVAKSGSTAKLDEVLQAISGFTAQQTRMGMNTANVSGYAESLTGLIGSKQAGLDPASAAALLGRVNASIAGGGSAGEAGQNFLYSALGSRLGLNPIQTKILQEQGAFGTGASTFGGGSMYSRFAGLYGLKTPGAAGNNATNLQLIKEHFERNYPGQPELMADAMANLFGVNVSQAMALSSIDGRALGGISSRVKRLGININDVNATGIARMSEIEANGSLSESDKDAQMRAAATQNQEETEGSRTRATINGVERAVVDLASKALPLFNDMRAGIMYLAGEGGKRGPRQIQEAVLRAESAERMAGIDADYESSLKSAGASRLGIQREKQELLARNRPKVLSGEMTQEEHARQMQVLIDREKAAIKADADAREKHRKAIEEETQALNESLSNLSSRPSQAGAGAGRGFINPPLVTPNDGGSGRTFGSLDRAQTSYDELFARYEKQYGLPPGVLKATALKENRGMNPNAMGAANDNGTVDLGLMQHNSRFLAERGITNWRDPEQSVSAAARLWRKNLDASKGDVRRAARMYNGSGPKAEAYADDFMRIYGAEAGTPLPAAGGAGLAGAPQSAQITVNGNFVLTTPNGQPAAAPIQTTGRVNLPSPQGTRPQ